jgi:adenosine deaminase
MVKAKRSASLTGYCGKCGRWRSCRSSYFPGGPKAPEDRIRHGDILAQLIRTRRAEMCQRRLVEFKMMKSLAWTEKWPRRFEPTTIGIQVPQGPPMT